MYVVKKDATKAKNKKSLRVYKNAFKTKIKLMPIIKLFHIWKLMLNFLLYTVYLLKYDKNLSKQPLTIDLKVPLFTFSSFLSHHFVYACAYEILRCLP